MSTSESRLATILAAILIAAGVYLRGIGFPKPVWLDEAWVANSVLSESWASMFYYESWAQTTPPALLVATRAVTGVFGITEAGLRALPMLLGCLTPLLAWLLARRVLTPPFQVLFTALPALNLLLVFESQQLKQYSGDAATGYLLLIVMWRYVTLPSKARFRQLLAAFVIAPALSYPSVCYAPAALLLVATVIPQDRAGSPAGATRARAKLGVLFSAAVVLAGGLVYGFLIAPNRLESLPGFWAPYLPDLSGFPSVIAFYIEKSELLLERLPFIARFRAAFFAFYVVAGAVGAIACIRSWRRRRQLARYLLIATIAPVATLLVLNLAHAYPFDGKRLSAFVLPCLFLLVSTGLESMWLPVRERLPVAVRPRANLLAMLFMMVPFAVFFHYARSQVVVATAGEEDMASVVRLLRDRVADEDLVYLHPTVVEQAKLYFRIEDWRPARVTVGLGSWPCCANRQEYVHRSPGPEPVVDDFLHHATASPAGRVWLVYTTREAHWEAMGVDEPGAILAALPGAGCRVTDRADFTGMAVRRIECAGAGSPATRR